MMLSVRLQCYNHANYLEQALNSIIAQKTNFPFEVVIGDDFSSDNSIEIIEKTIKGHTNPNITFRLLKREVGDLYSINRKKNGRLENFVDIINHCNGKYIALLDGDDYWTDPSKLQKQVDFLEQNNHFSGVATNSLVKYEGSSKEHLFKKKINPELRTNDLLEARHFHTATFMFRKTAFKDDFPKQVLSADRTLFLLVSCFGVIKLLEDVTAVYRKNDGGISRQVTSKQMKLDYNIAEYIKKYNSDFNLYKLKSFISKTVLEYSFKIYFVDFVKASIYLTYFNIKERKGVKGKTKSIKQSLKLIKKNFVKIG
ncbi:MAG: glycosyltransferase [Winogradskyella arenosi]